MNTNNISSNSSQEVYEIYIDDNKTNSSYLEHLENIEEFKNLNNANNYLNDSKGCETSNDKFELGFEKVGKYQVFDSFHPDDLIQPIDVSSIYN